VCAVWAVGWRSLEQCTGRRGGAREHAAARGSLSAAGVFTAEHAAAVCAAGARCGRGMPGCGSAWAERAGVGGKAAVQFEHGGVLPRARALVAGVDGGVGMASGA